MWDEVDVYATFLTEEDPGQSSDVAMTIHGSEKSQSDSDIDESDPLGPEKKKNKKYRTSEEEIKERRRGKHMPDYSHEPIKEPLQGPLD